MLRTLVIAVAVLVVLTAAAAAFVLSGTYDIGADDPHWLLTHSALNTLRARSIARRAADVQVPDLSSADAKRRGAQEYADMCVSCHLAPGEADTALRQGLYPMPPKLAEYRIEPKAAFWAIKHGIKASGMPAWGATHDDETIWSIVAFLQQLPDLTPQQFSALTAEAESATTGPSPQAAGHTHTHSSDERTGRKKHEDHYSH